VKLETLHLCRFRNYPEQTVSFGKGINILFGDNAQGKTNVIEAVHILATGKSHRTKHLPDLILHGENNFVVEADVLDADRRQHIRLSYDGKAGKNLTVNEVSRTRWSELLGLVRVLLFSPETMDIVKGGPSERRRFMDILLCQLDLKYLRALQQYTATLRNKAAALRDRKGFSRYSGMLPVWNEAMAASGAYITQRRLLTVNRLESLANHELSVISDGTESLSMSLLTFTGKDSQIGLEQLRELLLDKLEKNAGREEEAAQCMVGVHRDEILLKLNDSTARDFASQGQQRSIALSLILACMHLYRDEAGEMPILLLDDVMSELDPHRQDYLLSMLAKTQTLITATDRHAFGSRFSEGAAYYEVRHGTIARDLRT
jgi:DNA replication and repair protein RecF